MDNAKTMEEVLCDMCVMKEECSFEDYVKAYLFFRHKYQEFVDILNKLRPTLRYYSEFYSDGKKKVIKALSDGNDDSRDIAEVLGVTECEVVMTICTSDRDDFVGNIG